MKNLLTHDYDDLTISERVNALEEARQKGRESALADLGASSGEICDCTLGTYYSYVVDEAYNCDLCDDVEEKYFRTDEAENDPRVIAFCKAWEETIAEEQEAECEDEDFAE